jgi:hypothetical protein
LFLFLFERKINNRGGQIGKVGGTAEKGEEEAVEDGLDGDAKAGASAKARPYEGRESDHEQRRVHAQPHHPIYQVRGGHSSAMDHWGPSLRSRCCACPPNSTITQLNGWIYFQYYYSYFLNMWNINNYYYY